MKKNLNCNLFDSRWWLDFDYEEYKAECEDLGIEVYEEGSKGYWDRIYHLTEMYWDDCLFELQSYSNNNSPCMITGTLGLWNGTPDIVPIYKTNIYDAILTCVSQKDTLDWSVDLEDGYFVVKAYHHDGCNTFEVHLLSKRGINEVHREKYDYYDYEPKPYWFKKINDYVI